MTTTSPTLRAFLFALGALFTSGAAMAQSSVTIVKATNGQDANSPPGPIVTVGSTVTWSYTVTNTGSRDLTNVAVSDDHIGAISCPSTALAAGTSMICTASGVAVAGQYSNIGTVSATDALGGTVTASDPSHYYGQPAGLITLVKSTNGQDANSPPGPVVAPGSAVTWTYVVTNTSSADSLTSISVVDDQGVTVTCPSTTLTPGQSMTCTASGTAIAGQYSNVGTVTATHPVVGTIVASDASHYFGQNQNLDFGDAPDSYATSLAANGARHVLGTGVYLGGCADAELDGLASAGANGDDAAAGTTTDGTCATGGDDEDGVTFNGPLAVGQSSSVSVVATAPCTLSAWIDFDRNGSFSGSDDIFPGGRILAAGSNTLTFTVPAAASAGSSFARFRCTTDGVVSPTGVARDGEVEDYAVSIQPSAQLSVTKLDSPDPITPGAPLTYTLTVANGGPSAATAVVISDPLPAGTTFVSLTSAAGWTCTTPAAGSNGTISCTTASFPIGTAAFTLIVATASNLVPASTLSNTVTISSTAMDPVPGDNSSTAMTTIGQRSSDVSVTKTGSPDPVNPGTPLTYTITATNNGPSDAGNLTLADALPAGTTFQSLAAPAGWTCTTPAVGTNGAVSCSAALLAPGSAVFTLTVLVNASVTTGSTIANTATINSSTADPNAANNSSSSGTTVGAGQADLSVTKTAAGPITPGANVTYSIIVTNAGPSDSTSVALSDSLPAGMAFTSITAPAGWNCTTPAAGANGPILCTAPLLPASATGSFTLVATADTGLAQGSTISNTATVSAATPDPNAANNSSTAAVAVGTGQADLSVSKSPNGTSIVPGGTVAYAITVTNAGPSDAATITISDSLPAGMTFTSMTAPAAWTCTTPAVGASGSVSCTVPSMVASTSAVLTLVLTVAPDLPPGTAVSNTASVSSATPDPNAANDSATAVITAGLGMANLSVVKVDNPDPVFRGAPLTYTITVNNAGPSSASSVVLVDALPAETTFTAVVAPSGWACTAPPVGGSGSVSCTTAMFMPGTATFTLTTAVRADTALAATISNTASISTSTEDPENGNNSSTATTTTQAFESIPALSDGALGLLLLSLVFIGVWTIRKS